MSLCLFFLTFSLSKGKAKENKERRETTQKRRGEGTLCFFSSKNGKGKAKQKKTIFVKQQKGKHFCNPLCVCVYTMHAAQKGKRKADSFFLVQK
jgi:hypothetical protein